MNCAKCSKSAVKLNKAGIPVCSSHVNSVITAPSCPDCGLNMSIRNGKFGAFWGCPAFPMCHGTKKL